MRDPKLSGARSRSWRASEQGNTERTAGGAQFLVERGERQRPPMGEFQIRRIIERQPEAVGKMQ
jgi:hypothetical protein